MGPAQKLLIQVARGTKGGAGAKQKTDKVPEKELGEKNNSNISTSLCKQCIAMFTKHATFIQGNLKKALAMTDKPMKVNSECQQYRKSRIGELYLALCSLSHGCMRGCSGIDKMEDSVDQLLVQEVDGESVDTLKV